MSTFSVFCRKIQPQFSLCLCVWDSIFVAFVLFFFNHLVEMFQLANNILHGSKFGKIHCLMDMKSWNPFNSWQVKRSFHISPCPFGLLWLILFTKCNNCSTRYNLMLPNGIKYIKCHFSVLLWLFLGCIFSSISLSLSPSFLNLEKKKNKTYDDTLTTQIAKMQTKVDEQILTIRVFIAFKHLSWMLFQVNLKFWNSYSTLAQECLEK